jgi:repressor LexA
MTTEVTLKQQKILDYIRDFTHDNGYPPSVRDICKGVGLKSTSTVHGYLKRLKDKGVITKDDSKTRSIVLIDDARDDMAFSYSQEFTKIPVLGRIAAGEPILADDNIQDYYPIPSGFLKSNDYFMLTVSGESMINAGIFDGDYVLVQPQNNAENGDIVVAMLDDSATVKTFYKEDKMIRLQPQNDTMSPIYTQNVQVVGIVKGVFRFM